MLRVAAELDHDPVFVALTPADQYVRVMRKLGWIQLRPPGSCSLEAYISLRTREKLAAADPQFKTKSGKEQYNKLVSVGSGLFSEQSYYRWLADLRACGGS